MANDKVKQIDKEYLVTDDSVNVYGFRLLTSGYLLDRFKQNPIGYYLHAPKEVPREQGVLVRWDAFRIEGDKVYAKPLINLSHPRGERTVDEIEGGFLNAASVGKIIVVEFSDDPNLMLPGQTGPTVTKWFNKELSLVDIPGNENALAPLLFDEAENEINLTDFVQETLRKVDLKKTFNQDLKHNKMEFKKEVIKALNLADNTTDEAVQLALQNLVDKAAKVDGLVKDKVNLEKDLSDYKSSVNAGKIKDLTDEGTRSGKLTVKVATELAEKYKDDPDGLKSLIDGLPAYAPVTARIAKGEEAMRDLLDKSWDELDKSGRLPDLKAADFDAFKAKYKAKFKKDYQE